MKNTMKIDNSIAQTAETQAMMNPLMALDILREGNSRFVSGNPLRRDYSKLLAQTEKGQYPFAAVISCIDSRIPTEIIFDQGIGDIFNARIAGNFVNQDILGSMEFACKIAGVKLIVVMGHNSCGAVKGACDRADLGNLTHMLQNIIPAVEATETKAGEDRSSKNSDFVNRVALKNVELTISNIRHHSPILEELYLKGEIGIVGAMYDLGTGKVDFLQGEK